MSDLTAFLDQTHFVMPNLNDTFSYACADTEKIEVPDGSIMVAWWNRHGWYGLVALAAAQRRRHPVREVAEDQRYLAALEDLRSDEHIAADDDPEADTWRWWFEVSAESLAALGDQHPSD